uniref:Alpha-2-macroglobulin domain-containing protein n=1 Tax=Sphaeramia orbicularis TaxID=375764 RepID=A0A673C539_9TELE
MSDIECQQKISYKKNKIKLYFAIPQYKFQYMPQLFHCVPLFIHSIFAVTVSSQVRGGAQETLCAQIHSPTEPISLTVALNMDSESSVILEEVVKQDFYRCLTFQVPVVSRTSVASINKAKILIHPPSFIHIIQTDKPIYKPGQTGRYLISSALHPHCPPAAYQIPLQIASPSAGQDHRWHPRSSHPMIPEAAQGRYTITAMTDRGEQISHNFDIKEYVLPKIPNLSPMNLCMYLTVIPQNLTLTTDMRGMASFSLDTSLWKNSVTLKVGGWFLVSSQTGLSPTSAAFYSKSNSFLKIMQNNGKIPCDGDAAVQVQYIIQGAELKTETGSLGFLLPGKTSHFIKVSVLLREVINLAPVAQLVVYTVMPSGETVADSRDFPIQLCLNNKVSLRFSSLQHLPAEKTTLSLQAHPGSMCSIRAIDQSVLLLQSEQEITVDYLPVQKLSGYSYEAEDHEPYPCFPVPVPEPEIEPDVADGRTSFTHMFFYRDNGSVSVEKTVPDTITKWAAGAFCVSSVGFGVAPNTGLTAFQPFFVSLTLPYSVIRGEVFTLKATVFNYLSQCIMVKVTLADSEEFTSRDCDGCQYSVCLCGEESRTFSWIVTPTALGEVSLKVSAEVLKTDELCGNEVATVPDIGQIDTVVRTLLVQAEGTPQMVSHNALLCPADGPTEKNISLLMPEMFVAGSARATVSVLGDLMGRAMKNLNKLLAMPYGCGEQNMVLFAPNIFILNYLKSTGQLTKEILDKAVHFLESGYQRELTYKHNDGSYSAFGKSDESGNTWLTSFVMKSFGGARPYIYVNPQHIDEARSWLSRHQRRDGCIRSVGKLFHNGMKGGVSDDVSLTAYITAALLELDTNITDTVVQNCLRCLQTVVDQMDNLYTTALLSYTFTLAGDEDTRSKLITYLDQKSNTQGGTRHWERAGASGKGLDSLEVEMTSYVLLALVSGPTMPGFGLDYSSGIVRWLAQQQNPYGGFSSTQDTVVALQALAKYGAATYSEEGSTTVTVTSLGGLNKHFTVDQTNRLLYQEEKLSEVPGEYTVRAEGQSCVLAQISMHYNVPPPPDFSAFNISAHVMSKCNVSRPQLIVFVHVRYQGRREETNMVIINIKLLSGYILDKSSLNLVSSCT